MSKQTVKLNTKEKEVDKSTIKIDKPVTTKKEEPEAVEVTKEEVDHPTVELVDEVTLKNIPERSVKIRLRHNHSCSIGGTRYHFEKGKQYNVPLSVKEILLQSDMLSPL